MAQSGWAVIGNAGWRVDVKLELLQLQTGYPDDPPGGNHCWVCPALFFF